ncbi:MAG: MOSC domain-containing protein [Thermoflexales bacterium]
MSTVELRLAALVCYPIKSCRGMSVEVAAVEQRGLAKDRLMMVVDEDGQFVSQRSAPSLALIAPALAEDVLTLRAPNMPELSIQVHHQGARRRVRVWNDTCEAVDQGEAVADWLSHYLGQRVRLVRLADDCVRRVDPRYAVTDHDEVSFADGYPCLVTTQASLDALNARLSRPIPMDRFRPNLVIAGNHAFEEDTWAEIAVGDVRLALVKPCSRCTVITIDQSTGQGDPEPLRALESFRRRDGKVMFGQNAIVLNTGVVRVGDPVRVLQRKL